LETTAELTRSDLTLRSPSLRTARLDAIERALEEMAEAHSGYGMCARCAKMIDLDRLQGAPDTHVCQKCAEAASFVA